MIKELHIIHEDVRSQQRFAEAKNAGILTLSTMMMFGLLRLNLQHEFLQIFSYGMTLTAAIALLTAGYSFYPILNSSDFPKTNSKIDNKDNVYFFGDIAKYHKDTNAYLKLLCEKKNVAFENLNSTEEDLAEQIVINSRITLRKYKLFRYVLVVYTIGIVVSLLAPVLYRMIN